MEFPVFQISVCGHCLSTCHWMPEGCCSSLLPPSSPVDKIPAWAFPNEIHYKKLFTTLRRLLFSYQEAIEEWFHCSVSLIFLSSLLIILKNAEYSESNHMKTLHTSSISSVSLIPVMLVKLFELQCFVGSELWLGMVGFGASTQLM